MLSTTQETEDQVPRRTNPKRQWNIK